MGLGDRGRTDRERLGAVLQGVALLGHLEQAGLRLVDGWGSAGWVEGELAVGEVEPGPAHRLPQDLAADLVRRLFLGREASPKASVAGRGEARRAVRALLRRWDEGLVPLPPDLLVTRLLEEAPFLWESPFAGARRALAGIHADGELWVVGPGPFRWRLLRRADGDGEALGRLLDSGEARRYLPGDPTPATDAAGDGSQPDLATARAWLRRGRARRALEVAKATAPESPVAARLALAAVCHLHLGRLRSARRTAALGLAADPGPEERLELVMVEIRALANGGNAKAGWQRARDLVESWSAESEGAAGDGGLRLARAHLVAAQAAWDAAETSALAKHLAAAEALEGDPEHGPVLRQTRAMAALAAGGSEEAEGELTRALSEDRRRLPRYTAAGLWNDLGLVRARRGDLAGAEKAFARSLHLYRSCDGSRRTTLGLANLAEVRLRRGRLEGVEEILERTSAANRVAGNRRMSAHDLLLWGRFELAQGRASAALGVLRRAARRCADLGLATGAAEAELLSARALGWLGRPEEAAAELQGLSSLDDGEPAGGPALPAPAALQPLEPEERPALLAQAGLRDEALAAAGPWGPLWQAALTRSGVPPEGWLALDELPGYRFARAVFDLELVRPGCVPAARRRRAISQLRRRGADRLAARLEVWDQGPWRALAQHLAASPPGMGPMAALGGAADDGGGQGIGAAWATLLTDAGHPAARVWWESEDDVRVLVDAAGGGEELVAPCDGGRLVLRAPAVDAPLEALFELFRREAVGVAAAAARDAATRRVAPDGTEDGAGPEAGRRPPGGDVIVGDAPELRRAVERAERLAAGDVPLLIQGETGTGKELVARRVHRTSRRRDRPLVTVNCAALSETLILSDLFGHVRGAFTGADRERAGVFETAEGGTVFLDEIGDLPTSAQGMMLRVLQEGEVRRVGESLPRKVDVRVVAATHRDLAAMVEAGDFRRDLFYRLKGGAVELPPLRRRGRDVLHLADHLLAKAARREDGAPKRLSEEARGLLLGHEWPGNVRELENVLAVGSALAAADGGVIRAQDLELPGASAEDGGEGEAGAAKTGMSADGATYHQQVEALRRRLVLEALRQAGGNQSAAARALGLSRQAMSYLVRTLQVEAPAAG